MVQPRPASPTVKFVDEYCQWYKNLFSDVRSFEAFKYLHIGCISEIKRKTLPEIAKIVGLDNHQGLDHFLTSSPWYVMSKYPDITPRDVGNFYGLRTWVEYGLKQSKNELGWADFRLTHYPQIERWWEIICTAYLMVSLHSEQLCQIPPLQQESKFASHPWWDNGNGWKNILNNLRLIIQPFTLFNLIYPWLTVFPIPQLALGFSILYSFLVLLIQNLLLLLKNRLKGTIKESFGSSHIAMLLEFCQSSRSANIYLIEFFWEYVLRYTFDYLLFLTH